jgi:AraC-like DNA-binding protein
MIGKTRQQPAEVEEYFDPEVGRARGILSRHPPAAGKFWHSRRSPADNLVSWIDHYWMVRWDLRGLEPYRAQSLPHPNFQVVFEEGGCQVSGVSTRMFTRQLEGKSHVFGIKFSAGAFRPFLGGPASSLTDRTIAVNRVFGDEVNALEAILVSPDATEDEMIAAANAFFLPRLPTAPDEAILRAGRLVRSILEDRDVKTVDDLVGKAGIGKRTLQRIFNEYVGVNPKWVIRRYRLHELIERVHDSPKAVDWAQLALELGYFDQAHLINDFRSIVGYSPVRYQRQATKNSRRA